MLPYQANWPAFALPPARPPPLPDVVPFPLPGWSAADFFGSSFEIIFALSVFSTGLSAGALTSSSGVGLAEGFGDAFANTSFFGEGVGDGFAVGFGFGFRFGVPFTWGEAEGFGVDVDLACGVRAGVGVGVDN
jgi:hypothetical protein